MEPQKHYLSHVNISVTVQFRTNKFLDIPMQFQLRNNLQKHGTLPQKFPACLCVHICACVCDRDREIEYTHMHVSSFSKKTRMLASKKT